MFNVFFALSAVLGATVHLALSKQRRRDYTQVAATYLLYFLAIYVGVMGVFTAFAHVFRPAETSASIGWLQSPYEFEVGMADLTLGVLGILCVWIRGNFWLATSIGNAVWLLGDAAGHLWQMKVNQNHAPNNSGPFLVSEIATPIVILILMAFVYRSTNRPEPNAPGLSTPGLPTAVTPPFAGDRPRASRHRSAGLLTSRTVPGAGRSCDSAIDVPSWRAGVETERKLMANRRF